MHYRISGLPLEPFRHLIGADAATLAAAGAQRFTVTQPHDAPCRVGLEDAEPGETAILLNYEHQNADTPFRANGPIFVREVAHDAATFTDEVPDQIRRRPLSIRAYDCDGMMIDADVTDGATAEPLIQRLLANPAAAYLHIHFAKRGCYAARVDRL